MKKVERKQKRTKRTKLEKREKERIDAYKYIFERNTFSARLLSYVYAKNARGYLMNLQHCGKKITGLSPSVFKISLQFSLDTEIRLRCLNIYVQLQ